MLGIKISFIPLIIVVGKSLILSKISDNQSVIEIKPFLKLFQTFVGNPPRNSDILSIADLIASNPVLKALYTVVGKLVIADFKASKPPLKASQTNVGIDEIFSTILLSQPMISDKPLHKLLRSRSPPSSSSPSPPEPSPLPI